MPALSRLDLEVRAGTFFGLLGPNGAGKTTLIAAITDLNRGVTGEIRVLGIAADSPDARALVGLAEQDNNLDGRATASQTLILHGRLYGMSRAQARTRAIALVEQFGLPCKREARLFLLTWLFGLTRQRAVKADELSGGQRRRLVLARSLMHNPRLVILDEPTASVDVKQRAALWEQMRAMRHAGATVLLTTHDLDEAEALCDEVAFIEGGRIVARGTIPDLCARHNATDLHELYGRIIKEDR